MSRSLYEPRNVYEHFKKGARVSKRAKSVDDIAWNSTNSMEFQVPFWDAVNKFASAPQTSVARQNAVVEINALLRSLVRGLLETGTAGEWDKAVKP